VIQQKDYAGIGLNLLSAYKDCVLLFDLSERTVLFIKSNQGIQLLTFMPGESGIKVFCANINLAPKVIV
jgi:hypothetical protein